MNINTEITLRTEILDYILNNSIINQYFNKIEYEYRDDFRSHIWLIIMEMIESKWDKIVELYNKNELGKFIIGIINNQLKSNTSSFTKDYKNKKFIYPDDLPEVIDEPMVVINTRIILMKVLNILNNIHFVDAILFKLYYGIDPVTNEITEPKTYQQVQDIININYQTVRNSVMKTQKLIKESI